MKQFRFRSAVMKVASRCNIACTYCYMYELSDQSFSEQPKFMSAETIRSCLEKFAEYTSLRGGADFHVSLHGGEPLLLGRERMRNFLDIKNDVQSNTGISISVSMQTNATLLDREWVELLCDNKVHISISLDGPSVHHDKHRVDNLRKGTHSKVEAVIAWLRSMEEGRAIFDTVLCVLHPEMDGRELIKYFRQLGVNVDFILPDQNYVNGSDSYPRPDGSSYGTVLLDAYREWRRIDDSNFRVRKFELLMGSALGQTHNLDSLGPGSIGVFVMETSGEFEPVDSFKCCGDGFTKTGLTCYNGDLVELEKNSLVVLGIDKRSTAPSVCKRCEFFELCGGGYIPHRFDGAGFDNPTVYCSDMKLLCAAIANDVEMERLILAQDLSEA